MKRATLALLAALLLPALPAEAKFSSARVCGAHECSAVTFRDGHKLLVMEEPILHGVDVPPRGSEHWRPKPPSPPPEIAGWYRVTLCPGRCDADGAISLEVLPGAGYQYLGSNGWVRLDEPASRVYRAVTRGLEPIPGSRLAASDTTPPAEPAGAQPASTDDSTSPIPAWAWIALIAVVALAVPLSVRWLKRRPGAPSAP